MSSADLITQVAPDAGGILPPRRLPAPASPGPPAPDVEEAMRAAAAAARAHLRRQQRNARLDQQLPLPPSRSPSPTPTPPPAQASRASATPPTADHSCSPATVVPPLEPEISPPGAAPASYPAFPASSTPHSHSPPPQDKAEQPARSDGMPRPAPRSPRARQGPVVRKKASPLKRLVRFFLCASSETQEMAYSTPTTTRPVLNEKSRRPSASLKSRGTRTPSPTTPAALETLPSREKGITATSPSPIRDLTTPSPAEEKSIPLEGSRPTALAETTTTSASSLASTKDIPTSQPVDSASPPTEASPSAPALPPTQEGEYTLQAPSMQHKPSCESRWTHDSRPSSVYPPGVVGGTKLPRDETEDVLSGAVVPPGSSLPPPTPTMERNAYLPSSSTADLITAMADDGGEEEEVDSSGRGEEQHSKFGLDLAQRDALTPAEEVGVAVVPTEGDEKDAADGETDAEGEQVYSEEQWLQWELEEEQRLIMQGGVGIPHDEEGRPMPLLGEMHPLDKGRKCLVLDLDETLVHSSFKPLPQADFIVPVEIEEEVHHVYVAKRPGVDEFLRRMGELYEIVVFTASLSKYADPVLDLLDIHHVVHHRLFREHCLPHRGTYVKDLSMLGRELREIIILDNSPASYIFHASNAVPVSSWFSDPHDTELLDMCAFLQDLEQVEDVRAVLDGAL